MSFKEQWPARAFTIRDGATDPRVVVVKGRDRWALELLLQAGRKGCTPISYPGPRWSAYVFKLKKAGFCIETKRKRLMAEAAGADKMKAGGAEADLRALGSEPRAPLYPSVTAQEPTFEGLLKLFQIGRPALGLFSDEAGGFVGGHAMNIHAPTPLRSRR